MDFNSRGKILFDHPVDKVRVREDDVERAPALTQDVVLRGRQHVLVERAGAAEGLDGRQEVHVAQGARDAVVGARGAEVAALRLGVAAGAAPLVDPVAADRRVARARGQDLGRYSALSCHVV